MEAEGIGSAGRVPPTPTAALDLGGCDREPIHLPGSIQPHGLLLVLSEPEGVVVQASANVGGLLGRPIDAVLGRTLEDLLGPEQAADVGGGLVSPSLHQSPIYLRTVSIEAGGRRRSFQVVAHRHDGALIVELESTDSGAEIAFRDLYPLVRTFIGRAQGTEDLEELCGLTAKEVRRITGFDRVLIYRFDPDWHGCVVAEERGEGLESYLGLWFPASDIPRQARELYSLVRLRLIADAAYEPVPIVPAARPADGRPLDLSFASLRGVSPVHLEYLRNMGVAASMSIGVVIEGRLWGLISCHHRTPRAVPFEVRTACELVGQYLAQQLAARERASDLAHRVRLKSIQAGLLASMAAHRGLADGLEAAGDRLLEFAAAEGAAILDESGFRRIGRTPSEERVRALADRLAGSGGDVFHCDDLGELAPEIVAEAGIAGVLAIAISKLHSGFILWFRPEVVRTVRWGGDPNKPLEVGPGGHRLHPRKSFEQWKQTVRGRSRPWLPAEVAVAGELRNDILGIVLRRAEELADLAAELRRSNQELESFSYSVSHDLRAPFRHIAGFGELLRERAAGSLDPTSSHYLDTMMEAAEYAGTLVDNLLAFSKLSRTALTESEIDMNALVDEVRRELALDLGERAVEWRIGRLPAVVGDLELIRLVIRNLLSNAVKYTRGRPETRIEVTGALDGREAAFHVRDNGVGFDMKYVGKLFGVFQRLHRMEDFEGTGIGLANVRRIISRHGGRCWAEGRPEQGATFSFTMTAAEET